MINKVANIMFLKNSKRRKLIKKVLVKLRIKSPYIAGYYNTIMQQYCGQLETFKKEQDLSKAPTISIVVPAYNTPERYLDDLVYSIISQVYEKWELILVNASTNDESRNLIESCALRDERIKVINFDNKGISENTNYGIKASSGDYIAFCDHDDILEPNALYEVALKIVNEKAELIYSDEDKISDDGKIYFDPHYKPDWSPDLLTHVNYINHLTVVKKSLFKKVGMLNSVMDGAQDYDLLLRLVDEKPKIVHIPKVLYHWRAAKNSTAQDFSSKKNITNAGKKALENHFERSGLKVKAAPKENKPGFYELIFQKEDRVSLIVSPFTQSSILKLFIELLIKKTNCDNVEIELLIPEGICPRISTSHVKLKTIKNDSDFLEKAVKLSKNDKVVIFNRIALPNDRDWATRLSSVLRQEHIKTVSPLIIQNGCIIDDCGLVIDSNNNYARLFEGFPAYNTQTFFGNTNWVRNVDAVSGGVVVVNKQQFTSFLKKSKRDVQNPIFEFSRTNDLYNTIYSEVVFDSFAIQLLPIASHAKFFNENLLQGCDDYMIYTPECCAMNILINIAENEGLSL